MLRVHEHNIHVYPYKSRKTELNITDLAIIFHYPLLHSLLFFWKLQFGDIYLMSPHSTPQTYSRTFLEMSLFWHWSNWLRDLFLEPVPNLLPFQSSLRNPSQVLLVNFYLGMGLMVLWNDLWNLVVGMTVSIKKMLLQTHNHFSYSASKSQSTLSYHVTYVKQMLNSQCIFSTLKQLIKENLTSWSPGELTQIHSTL